MSELIGQTFTVEFPFVRCVAEALENDGPHEFISWKPGIDYRPFGPEDTEGYANGIGKMHLTVVGEYKPGRFPTRVFYTREWETPEGKRFGKTNVLRITTKGHFNRLCKGYEHEFVVDPEEEPHPVAEFKRKQREEEGFRREMAAPLVDAEGRLPWE